MARALSGRRRRITAILVTVLLLSPGGCGGGDGEPASEVSRKVLMIGLDGADWDIVDPLMARGDLPNLKSLVDNGVRARLRTVAPILSPVVWTSIATGKRPRKHGIHDFLAVSNDGKMVPVTSTLWQARPVWSILGEAGIPSAITAWWATWPAEELKGYMATDRISYQLFRHLVEDHTEDDAGFKGRGKTWPPGLYEEIAPLIVQPAEIGTEDISVFVDLERLGTPDADDSERLEELRTAIASTRTYEAIGQMLLRKQPYGFHSVYNESTDTVAHLFMPFRPPRRPGVDRRRAEAFGGVMDAVYRDADAMIGRLLESIDDDWTVIVLSDHGFKHAANRPSTDSRVNRGAGADWHDRFGILVMSGPDIREGVSLGDATILDIAPTLLALYGLPVGRDMDGEVLTEALQPEFLAVSPVTHVESYDKSEREVRTTATSSDQDNAMMEKLRALGYITADYGAGGGYTQDNARAHNNLGISLLSSGDFDGALAEFEKGLEAGGGMQSLLNMANLHLIREDADSAAELIARMERESPDFRSLPALKARLADLRGDKKGAERLLRKAIEVDPADSRSLTRLAHLEEESNRIEQALAHYREAARVNPENAESFNYIGNILRRRGDLRGAEEAYRASVKADPKYAGGYNNLGLLLQQSGRHEEARQLYAEALEDSPGSALLHNSLGSLLIVKGELDRAEASVRQALEIEPGMAEALNNLGIILASRGRTAEARARFLEALASDDGNVGAHFNLAKVELLMKRFENALHHFSIASDLDPRHLDAAIGAGETAYRLGMTERSIEYFGRAQALAPGNERIGSRLQELRSR